MAEVQVSNLARQVLCPFCHCPREGGADDGPYPLPRRARGLRGQAPVVSGRNPPSCRVGSRLPAPGGPTGSRVSVRSAFLREGDSRAGSRSPYHGVKMFLRSCRPRCTYVYTLFLSLCVAHVVSLRSEKARERADRALTWLQRLGGGGGPRPLPGEPRPCGQPARPWLGTAGPVFLETQRCAVSSPSLCQQLRMTVWSLCTKSVSYIKYPKACQQGESPGTPDLRPLWSLWVCRPRRPGKPPRGAGCPLCIPEPRGRRAAHP